MSRKSIRRPVVRRKWNETEIRSDSKVPHGKEEEEEKDKKPKPDTGMKVKAGEWKNNEKNSIEVGER